MAGETGLNWLLQQGRSEPPAPPVALPSSTFPPCLQMELDSAGTS